MWRTPNWAAILKPREIGGAVARSCLEDGKVHGEIAYGPGLPSCLVVLQILLIC